MDRMNLPDRLSADKRSPYFGRSLLKYIGVRFNGEPRKGDVNEYDRVAGWIDVRERNEAGKFRLVDGQFVIKRVYGEVEPFWEKEPPAPRAQQAAEVAQSAVLAAAEKRARKMAKRASEAARGPA